MEVCYEFAEIEGVGANGGRARAVLVVAPRNAGDVRLLLSRAG
jgi:hypothetical protein